jgi:hypothetical protein
MLVGSVTVRVDRLREKAHVLSLASDDPLVICVTLLYCIMRGEICFARDDVLITPLSINKISNQMTGRYFLLNLYRDMMA